MKKKIKEWLELDFQIIISVLVVLTGPEAEVEAQLYQDGNVVGLRVGRWGGCCHNDIGYT